MTPIGTQGKEISRPSLSAMRRIFAKLKVKGNCWLWTGAITSTGYGLIRVRDKPVRVHRAVFASFYGDIPKGFDVHHRCHECLCANPEHLSLLARGANVVESNCERSKHQHRSGDTARLFDLGSGEEVEAVRCSACCGRGWIDGDGKEDRVPRTATQYDKQLDHGSEQGKEDAPF